MCIKLFEVPCAQPPAPSPNGVSATCPPATSHYVSGNEGEYCSGGSVVLSEEVEIMRPCWDGNNVYVYASALYRPFEKRLARVTTTYYSLQHN